MSRKKVRAGYDDFVVPLLKRAIADQQGALIDIGTLRRITFR